MSQKNQSQPAPTRSERPFRPEFFRAAFAAARDQRTRDLAAEVADVESQILEQRRNLGGRA